MTSLRKVYQHEAEHTGSVGVEIEMEGSHLPKTVGKWWSVKEDPSLRNGLEYVFKKPLTFEESKEALQFLKYTMDANKVVFRDSIRAGTHIHINVLDMELKDIAKVLVVYFVLENLLIKFCGRGRDGNVFCLKASDATYLMQKLIKAFETGRFGLLYNDDIRYSAMNLKALGQYGSLEFRAIRTTYDFSVVEMWIGTLLKIRDSASLFNSPRDIMTELSAYGGVSFINKVLGEYASHFSSKENVNELLREGVNNVQDFVYCIDWDGFDGTGKNPFKKKVMI